MFCLQPFGVEAGWRLLFEDLGIDKVGGLLSGEDLAYSLYDKAGHGLACFFAGTSQMGGEDDVFQGEQAGMDLGFIFVNIESSPTQVTALEGLHQRCLIDNRSPGRVDQDAAGFHLLEGFFADQVVRFGGEGAVQRDDVALGEQFGEGEITAAQFSFYRGLGASS